MDEVKPQGKTERSTFTVKGEVYDLLHDSDFTTAELALIEDVSGFTPIEFSEALFERGSAKALQAYALIHVRRKYPRTGLDELGELNYLELFEGIKFIVPEKDKDPTQTEPSDEQRSEPSGSPDSANGSRGSEKTPGTDGNQPSVPTSL